MDVYRLNQLEKEMEDHLGVLFAQDPNIEGYLVGTILVDNSVKSDSNFKGNYIRHYSDKNFREVSEHFTKGLRRLYGGSTTAFSSTVFINMNNIPFKKMIFP